MLARDVQPAMAMAARILLVLALLLVCVHAGARENRPLLALIAYLRADDAGDRKSAAEELYERGPDARAVPALILAAKVETDHGALIQMLRALGKSGAVEALGVIQLHAQSPAKDLRNAGRAALAHWLRVNRVLGEDEDLPDPPHRFYGTPPPFPPDRPAGRPFTMQISPDAATPPPYYESPPPGGVPPGFHFEERPRKGLVIAGSVVFGALYTASAIPGAMSLSEPNALNWLLVPVAGPIVLSASMFGHSGDFAGLSTIFGIILIVDGVGQLAGLAMLTAGLAATEQHLAPGPQLSLSPGGAQLRWQF